MAAFKKPAGQEPSWRILRHTAMVLLVISLVVVTTRHTQVLKTITRWPPFAQPPPRELQFSPSATLKISVFSDLHFGEAESTDWGPEQDSRTLRVMASMLDTEVPDLVVLNGDLITGDDTQLENATDYLDMLVAPMVQRSVPWASAYGNHDNHFNINTETILEKERGYYSLSLTEKMVTGKGEEVGVSNYYVPVYQIGKNGPVAMLWFFDSRGGMTFQKNGKNGKDGKKVQLPGVVDPTVTKWFVRTSRNLRRQHRGESIPSLVFVHIPLNAMRQFQEAGVDEHRQPGINDDVPLASQTGDEEFLNALSEEGVAAVFSGHDHGNDWCMSTKTANKQPLFACFGRHTGYGGYGRWMRGSRQILLTSDGEIETWIRLEDGDVSGRVSLNSTYGQDIYPKARKAFTSLGAGEAR
ncbi:uncharacterized protein A1O9_05699 [Exophiala aquamarina CBS 119918]|uniref:Calcineurin-like phosphoesterase domain-containing protein n=1 Tax=Exophiala aquamarina CBS 119918 TaxID=1182545 RepID=A0A072PCJ0_9EURO|nr:uncharacterized protein A1O9_05699 [Exophiala aquamarina CBS 119918]KEF57779.1 hypothetical protein A1O9_05699 [Exophiala aquamarina CBS 119918]